MDPTALLTEWPTLLPVLVLCTLEPPVEWLEPTLLETPLLLETACPTALDCDALLATPVVSALPPWTPVFKWALPPTLSTPMLPPILPPTLCPALQPQLDMCPWEVVCPEEVAMVLELDSAVPWEVVLP